MNHTNWKSKINHDTYHFYLDFATAIPGLSLQQKTMSRVTDNTAASNNTKKTMTMLLVQHICMIRDVVQHSIEAHNDFRCKFRTTFEESNVIFSVYASYYR
jgi:hypothetical protein